MRTRTAALAFLVAAASTAACSLMNDLDGYAGGVADTGTPAIIDSGVKVDSFVPPVDTGEAKDTASPDTNASDTNGSDTKAADTSVTDTMLDTGSPVDTGIDTGTVMMDTPPCGLAFKDFGTSEVMVRGTFGVSDKREWIEITNYGTSALDVSGVTVKVFSSTEKASLTIPGGTTVAAGGSIVIAGDRVAFSADVPTTYGLGTVLEFGRTDYLINSAPSEIRLIGPTCTTPYETLTVPTKTWTVGRAWAYPPPSTTCPATARVNTDGTAGAAWKEVPTITPYGAYATDGGMQNLYGTPTKANNAACP